MVLVGILSSVVAGRYGRSLLRDLGARTEAHQLWVDLQRTRKEAIRRRAPHTLLLSGPTSGPWTGYSIFSGAEAEARAGSADTIDEAREFPTDTTATGDSAAIEFDAEGQASRAVMLQLRGPERSWSVQVFPLTGSVKVSSSTSS